MDEKDPFAELRQVERFLDGRVAAADDRQVLVAEDREGAVARCAGRDAAAPEPEFRFERQPPRRGAGGDDQGVRGDRFAIRGGEGIGPGRQIDRVYVVHDHPCLMPDRLLAHIGHELRPSYAVWKAREVLDMGGDHELSARNAARLKAFNEERVKVRAGRIDSRCQSCRARADDNETFSHEVPFRR